MSKPRYHTYVGVAKNGKGALLLSQYQPILYRTSGSGYNIKPFPVWSSVFAVGPDPTPPWPIYIEMNFQREE
jgi:hypothetical protein